MVTDGNQCTYIGWKGCNNLSGTQLNYAKKCCNEKP